MLVILLTLQAFVFGKIGYRRAFGFKIVDWGLSRVESAPLTRSRPKFNHSAVIIERLMAIRAHDSIPLRFMST
jgi:hypothetical protein